MKKISRREFLKLAAAGTGGVLLEQLLTSCGVQPAASTPGGAATSASAQGETSTPFQPGAETPTSEAPQPTETASSTPKPPPDMVVVRGGEPEALVRRALESFGGMQ